MPYLQRSLGWLRKAMVCGVVFMTGIAGATACECIGGTTPPTVSSADAVFVGVVVGLETKAESVHVASRSPDWCGFRYTDVAQTVDICIDREVSTSFRVVTAWRGIDKPAALTVRGADSCSFRFQIGQPYLVFASRGPDDRLEADICSGTALLNEASETLKSLGEPKIEFQPPTAMK